MSTNSKSKINERVLILREAVVKITQMLSGKGIKVTQRGVNAYVQNDHTGKPILVNLPYLPDNATDELCDAIQGFLDHEVAHILFTNFMVMIRASKVPNLFSKVNILEDSRIEREMAKKFAGSGSNLATTGRFFLSKYTTPKLNEAIAEGNTDKIVGILFVPLIRSMAGQAVFAEYMQDKMSYVEPVYDLIKDLEIDIRNASSTEDCFNLAVEIDKRMREETPPSGSEKGEESESDGSSGGTVSVAVAVKGKSAEKEEEEDEEKGESATVVAPTPAPADDEEEKEKEKEEEEETSTSSTEEKKEGEFTASAEEEGKPEGEIEEEEESTPAPVPGDPEEEEEEETASPAPSGESDEEGETEGMSFDGKAEEEGDGDGKGSPTASGESHGPVDTEVDLKDMMSGPMLDEIDKESANDYGTSISTLITNDAADSAKSAPYLVFTKEDDVVEMLPVGSEYRPEMFMALSEAVDHMVSPLQKDLERAICARSLSTWENGRKSGRLHTANLARLASGDPRVFRRKHENISREVAVSLVIDSSGSMGGAKVHLAAQAAYALASVLERLRIPYEVIGFTTGQHQRIKGVEESERKIGREYSRSEPLYMPIIKSFDERMNAKTKERFGWLPNSRILSCNIDGESILVAAQRLWKRTEESKVMIVLSDGAPAGWGDHNALQQHLKDSVKLISSRKTNIVGMGIMTDCVKQFYPKNVVINNVNELPTTVIKELRRVLTA